MTKFLESSIKLNSHTLKISNNFLLTLTTRPILFLLFLLNFPLEPAQGVSFGRVHLLFGNDFQLST